jgi:alpha-L-fucosidase
LSHLRSDRSRKLAWWRHARFGLFVHWGVYAVPGGSYQGKREPYYAEWLMLRAKIPCGEYRTYANAFTAERYDPRAWVAAARDAGMNYLVITTKHHDGFTLFDSKVNDWTVTRSSPYGRDALAELVEACRDAKMPIGFYYSQAQDWMNGGAATGGFWDASQKRDMDAYVDGVVIPHLRELLTNYGPDAPAILWWDTPVGMDENRARRIEDEVRRLRPDLIMNNRLYIGHTGDILTPEQRIPTAGYPGRDWETCMTMNKTWGFAHDDEEWKSTDELVRNLVDVVSKGGNYLLNVGPDAHGAIPAASLDRLAAIGRWMKVHGESIVGARGVLLDDATQWGRCTTRDLTLYAHVTNWPDDGVITLPPTVTATSARTLHAPEQALRIERDDAGVRIHLPARPEGLPVTVVAITLTQPMPDVQLPLCRVDAEHALSLPAASGELFNVRDEDVIPTTVLGGKEATITYWKNPDEACRWRGRVPRAGTYRVKFHHAVAPEEAGSRFELAANAAVLQGTVPATASWVDYQLMDVGSIELEADVELSIVLKPLQMATPRGFLNLKSVTLVPA